MRIYTVNAKTASGKKIKGLETCLPYPTIMEFLKEICGEEIISFSVISCRGEL